MFLNEIGVDPGIDHMSAMKIIHAVEAEGGKVLHFHSYCGGLPAPEDNDNPFGYKFSWSPRGVVLASRNSARFLENGKIVEIEGKNLFLNSKVEEIEGLGKFEVYPNRDSVPYKELYGLKDALTVIRGTYRNLGWCETLKKIVDLGLVDETPRPELKGLTFKQDDGRPGRLPRRHARQGSHGQEARHPRRLGDHQAPGMAGPVQRRDRSRRRQPPRHPERSACRRSCFSRTAKRTCSSCATASSWRTRTRPRT